MAYIPAQFRPGIFKEASELAAGDVASWNDGNLVRFWKGQPQPIGGWAQQTTTNSLLGTPRNLADWTTIDNTQYIAIGTNSKIYIYDSGTYNDITPVRDSGSLGTDPFTTTTSSSLVSVEHTAHGITTDTYARFAGSTAINGVTMVGEYIVTAVTDANNYVVESAQTATGGSLDLAATSDTLDLTTNEALSLTAAASAGGGASVTYSYDINAGPGDAIAGLGWGSDSWGDGTWGAAGSTSALLFYPRTWALPTWGEDLIINPRGGALYLWDASVGVATRATTALTGSPSTCQFAIVSPHTRYLIAFGAHTGSVDDPLFIRWPSQNNYADWTPSETNTAGDARVDQGSSILSAIISANGDIGVFTDEAMYIMQFVDQPFLWNVELVGSNAGIVSPGAAATWANHIWYMGEQNFFVYDGRVQVLECDVESHVFDDMNLDQKDKFYAVTNSEFQEVTFFYVSSSASEIDRFASYNWKEKTWNIGILSRTTFHDHSELFHKPYAYDASGNLYVHEDTANPPAGVYLESGAIQIGQGDSMMFTDRVIPDFERNDGTVNITISGRDYPARAVRSKGPYPMTSSTEKVDFRLRTRQTKIRLESENVDWRLSSLRLNAKPDGKR